MNALRTEAIDSLKTTVESLLPEITELPVEVNLLFSSLLFTPTGLGGFIGINEAPQGDIVGIRLEASVVVTVTADTFDVMNAVITALTNALVGADLATLRAQGILRISLDEVKSRSSDFIEQVLTFKILYEFLQQPQEAEEVIQEIPISLDVG